MIRRRTRSTRTYTLLPYTTLFRSQPMGTLDYREEEYRAIFEQNLFSAFEMCRLAHPQLVQHANAAIVNVGSRSEEHTSELQSLMRISYAVFCLKKKQKKATRTQVEIHLIISKLLQNTYKTNK